MTLANCGPRRRRVASQAAYIESSQPNGHVPRFADGLASTIVSGLLNPTVKERVHIERYLRFNRL